MKKWIGAVLLAISSPLAYANNYPISAGASTATIQSTINTAAAAGGGNSVTFAAGSYSITSQINIPCPASPLTIQGPIPSGVGRTWPITPTAVLTSTLTNNWAFSGNACNVGTTFQYLQYNGGQPSGGGGGFLFVPPGMNNLTVTYNWFYGVSALQNTTQQTDTFIFAGNGSTSSAHIQGLTIKWNRFGSFGTGECGGNGSGGGNTGLMNLYGAGNFCSGSGYAPPSGSTSCLYQGASDITHGGGSCGGVGINNNYDNLNINNNSFTDLEQPLKLYEAPSGNWNSTNLLVQYNDLAGTHRIGSEAQSAIAASGPAYTWDSNVFRDPIKPNSGQWGLSLPLAGGGTVNSTNNVLIGNVAISNDKNGQGAFYAGCGIEFWGNGTSSQNLIQGNWCAGILYGYTTGGWSANNNTIQVPAHPGQCIVDEGQHSTPPSQTGNVCSSTLSSVTSVAPSISPSSGAQTYPLTVTLTDAGNTGGSAGPRGNTGIWYTTDGSTPAPGSGTAQYLATGGTFVLSAPATVNAVGMWGALNQPTSYPAGYGFIPSAETSATYTSGGGTQVLGNSTDNSAGGTYPNYFNDVYAVTGINAAGYTVNTGTVCIAPGTVTNGYHTDIGINTAPTATTEGTTALCHATYTNSSSSSPGCVTVPLNGCGLLSSNKAYWLWTITNDPLAPSPLYFSNCGGTCNGAAPTSPGVGTYSGFYLAGTYGSYAAMSSTFTGQNPGQPSVYLGVTPAVEYGVTTTSVNDATSANYFNDVYAVTGSSSGGYTVNAGTVCIAPGTVTQGKQTDIGINTAPTATTEGATALCHATYTNTSPTSPGCVTVPLSGCGTLSPNTPYWLWTITNDPIQGSPLYFSNCGGTCNGSAPTSAGVGAYGGFYLHGTYGTYTGMSSAFTGGPSAAQPSVSLSLTPQ